MAVVSKDQSHRPAPAGTLPPVGRPRSLRFRALGTECLVLFACEDDGAAAAFEHAARTWTETFEARYSRFRPGSLVDRINAAAGQSWVEIDAEASRLFDLAGQLALMTGGILDATALPLLRLWNYQAAAPRVPSDSEITAARQLVGWSKVQRAPGKIFLPQAGMGLDLGGFGKEYAVDAVAELAAAHRIAHVLVDYGHDVRALGRPNDAPWWRVGVEDPTRPGTPWATLGVSGRGVATSGDYLRGFSVGGKRYGHILDPRTGRPVANGTRSVTVVANSCLEAGVLSTTAFVLGPLEGLRLIEGSFGTEGCIRTDTTLSQTRGFYALRCDQT